MNLAEGVRRIYLTLTCLILVVSAFSLYEDRPTEQRLTSNTVNAIKDAIAVRNNQKTYVEFLKKSDAMFFEEICMAQEPNRFEEIVDLCNRHKFEKIELPRELIYHALYSVVTLLLVSLCAFLFWILTSWISRGFTSDKRDL